MNINKVYEGLLQCHNITGLLAFSKELQKFVEVLFIFYVSLKLELLIIL